MQPEDQDLLIRFASSSFSLFLASCLLLSALVFQMLPPLRKASCSRGGGRLVLQWFRADLLGFDALLSGCKLIPASRPLLERDATAA